MNFRNNEGLRGVRQYFDLDLHSRKRLAKDILYEPSMPCTPPPPPTPHQREKKSAAGAKTPYYFSFCLRLQFIYWTENIKVKSV